MTTAEAHVNELFDLLEAKLVELLLEMLLEHAGRLNEGGEQRLRVRPRLERHNGLDQGFEHPIAQLVLCALLLHRLPPWVEPGRPHARSPHSCFTQQETRREG